MENTYSVHGKCSLTIAGGAIRHSPCPRELLVEWEKVTTSWDDLSRNREKNRAHRHTWQGYQLATRASTPGHAWAKLVVSFFFFF